MGLKQCRGTEEVSLCICFFFSAGVVIFGLYFGQCIRKKWENRKESKGK